MHQDRHHEHREPFNEVDDQLVVTQVNHKPYPTKDEYDEKFNDLLGDEVDVSRIEHDTTGINYGKENIPSLEEKVKVEKKKKNTKL